MTARKKTARSKTARKKTPRKRSSRRKAKRPGWNPRGAVEESLRELEQRLPLNLRKVVRDLRANLASIQRQADRMRAKREARLRKLGDQMRRDAARLLHRLEKAVAPSAKGGARRKASARKAPRRKAPRKKR